ncbi:VOC family protein [Spirosoma sp. HMF4905]|uniref:VOC family protein n=1 Tax=Spirosoma arboris TaxID=2682092 RepID=A0A7K1SPM4_9BACT|nr:VOC family protein [Spirosoma arboris]MVM35633.1 VOC family protein [Spirosoma arboris]
MNPALNQAICYIEFPAHDLVATKDFYQQAFGWSFEDYGPDYTSFVDGRIAGGFFKADGLIVSHPLVVIWADDLEESLRVVEQAGGIITKPIFSYPSGRRFHFTDPTGNELAVCSA